MQGMALDAKGPQTNWGHLKFSFCTFFDSVQFLLASSKVEFVRITEAEKQAPEGTILLTITASLWLVWLVWLVGWNEVLQIDSRTGNPSTFFCHRTGSPQDISQLIFWFGNFFLSQESALSCVSFCGYCYLFLGIVSSDRSSYSDDVLLHTVFFFFKFPISRLMQLMLEESLLWHQFHRYCLSVLKLLK